jgi:hypothetical protein
MSEDDKKRTLKRWLPLAYWLLSGLKKVPAESSELWRGIADIRMDHLAVRLLNVSRGRRQVHEDWWGRWWGATGGAVRLGI